MFVPSSEPAGDPVPEPAAPVDSSVVIADTGFETLPPLQLWSEAMKKYKILAECEEMCKKDEEQGQILRDEAYALGEAVAGI